jgi:adenine deaminase
MNFPGVVSGSETELEKLALPGATHVDGHAPSILGKELNAYAAAGIRSDHEMSTIEEGRQRLRVGMWALIREASGARNLHALLPLVEEFGPHRLAFCTDDREPEHIAEEGHINSMVRDAVAAGVRPEDALVMASFNSALWHGLRDLGALAPGYQADVLILPDLESFAPETVLKAGREVGEITKPEVPDWVKNSVRIRPLSTNDFTIPWTGDGQARVIGIVPDQIVTDSLLEEPRVDGRSALADPERDLLKIAVIERHLGTGRIGLGFVRGFGLKSGALASTVAHDAHNVVVVGVKDDDMLRAVRRLSETGGGVVVIEGGIVRAELKLPVAGLLSDASLEDVIQSSRACVEAARALGCELASPFQSMAFLALSVIPSLKITDRGLVDVDRFELVPLQA